ncbi:hypothetical protein ACFOUP_02450 [Belliella kenyensis]|uniref:Class IIb bacteriocin, lactobin A/cerein 7B family n=1 Tax=Belliella kenyensis TaxID=1472724 RepID=A0ABV8EI17_9BACT|nr:hypothetical protein [Belliella kenyensis]MCH7400941.1 hypothetical protein [Belliella kenyensis]MDN3603940.1 hypothetical protein [Belliella kenyensis]
MRELSIEKMEMVSGGGCPWYTGTLVGVPFYTAALLSGPAGWAVGASGLVANAVVAYACRRI